MKTLLPFVLVFVGLNTGKADILVIEGKYQNKNILVQNSFVSNGVGYCAKEVRVNGNITTDETNSNAFEIDLKALKLTYGQNVLIEIQHMKGCVPKVLNMEDLTPRPTFETIALNLNTEGLLNWTSKNESGVLPYIVEQFKWNKWIPVGEVDGIGSAEIHAYSFKVTLHSGTNKFRIRQKGLNSEVKVSKDVTVKSKIDKPSYDILSDKKSIDFTSETAYEVYDIYGINLMKGFSNKINISRLNPGNYYLCYDNSTVNFSK